MHKNAGQRRRQEGARGGGPLAQHLLQQLLGFVISEYALHVTVTVGALYTARVVERCVMNGGNKQAFKAVGASMMVAE